METMADRIRNLRIKNNLTQKELAEKLNVATPTINKYEKRTIENIPIEKLQKLSDILGTTTDYLMNGTTEETQEDKLIKILVKKTLEGKIEWVVKEYVLSYEPFNIDNNLVRYEDIENYISQYYEINLNYFSLDARFAFTEKQIFIFTGADCTLYFGNKKSLQKIEKNKNLDNLYKAIFKPLSFINSIKIDNIIDDLENL